MCVCVCYVYQPKFNGMSAECTHLIERMLVRVVILECIYLYLLSVCL